MSNKMMKDVILTTSNMPKAGVCKTIKADGTTSYQNPYKSDYNYGDSTATKIGGKSAQNASYFAQKEGE